MSPRQFRNVCLNKNEVLHILHTGRLCFPTLSPRQFEVSRLITLHSRRGENNPIYIYHVTESFLLTYHLTSSLRLNVHGRIPTAVPIEQLVLCFFPYMQFKFCNKITNHAFFLALTHLPNFKRNQCQNPAIALVNRQIVRGPTKLTLHIPRNRSMGGKLFIRTP